jgi:autotransporter-associated beta strand protein
MKVEDQRMYRNTWVMMALAAGVALGTSQFATAASGTWTNTSGGLWDTDANWSGSVFADGSGNTADFSTLDITAMTTVSLNSPRTIGNLIFGDTTNSTVGNWVLNNNSTPANILTLSGTTPTITVNDLGTGTITNSTVTIIAKISGTNGLVKDGTGTVAVPATHGRGVLVLSGANDYSGGTTISSGALRVESSSALGTGAVTVASGAQLQIRGVTIANTININGSSALFSNAGSGSNLSGIVNLQSNSTVNLATNAGNGTLTLSGTVNLNGNVLTATPAGTANVVTISGVINGIGGITKESGGELRINNDNSATYSGTTTLRLGVLQLGSDGALGTGTFAFSSNNDQGATIRSSNTTARTIGAAVTIGAVAGTANAGSRFIFGSATTGDLTFTNTTDINLGATQRRFEVGNVTQFDAGFTGSAGITKQSTGGNGNGTLIINGNSSYAGTTAINAGTLLINGTHTGGGAYTVAVGATFGGSGSTASAVTVIGTVAPGNSIGTLGVGAATFADNSILSIELGAASASDLLEVTGLLNLDSTLDTLVLSGAADGSSYTIATYGSLSGTFNSVTGLPENYVLDYGTGLNSAITLTLIPEPGTLALVGAAGLLMLKRRRYDLTRE